MNSKEHLLAFQAMWPKNLALRVFLFIFCSNAEQRFFSLKKVLIQVTYLLHYIIFPFLVHSAMEKIHQNIP